MNVCVVTDFSQIPEAFVVRFSFPANGEFFLSLDWFHCLHETCRQAGKSLRIYCASDDAGNPAAMLYCQHDARRRCLHSLTNFYTMLYAPAVAGDPGEKRHVLDYLLRYISQERPRWRSLAFRFVPNGDREKSLLQLSLEANDYWCDHDFQYENWYLDVAGQSFEDYFAARPSKLRNTVKRKSNKLHREHDVEFILATSADDDLERCIEDFVGVYNKSWKRPEPYPEFIPVLARACAGLGILRLGVLYVDNQPAAAQFWIVTDTRATIYKLAYDEDYASKSVGSVLSRYLFESILNSDQPGEIDYGVGSEAYKRDWMAAARTLGGLRAVYRKSLHGFLLINGARARKAVKRLLRR